MRANNRFKVFSMISDLYSLAHEKLLLEGHEIEVIKATNLDELLDHLLDKGDEHEDVKDERIPYFAELWPSAINLAAYLLANPEIVAGKSVLELGCGSGLSGIAAGLAGAREVLMTDYLDDALAFAAEMWKMNLTTAPATALLDWRSPDPSLRPDVILAADVAYEARNFAPLIHTFKTILPEGGTILLTEPSRLIARDFIEMLTQEGFTLNSSQSKTTYDGLEYLINLHKISR